MLQEPIGQYPMPKDIDGLILLFSDLAELCPRNEGAGHLFCGVHSLVKPCNAAVYVEHLQPFPLMSRKGVWTLAENYGSLLAVIRNAGLNFKRVRPMEWQKTLNVRCKGDKERLWELARGIYPACEFNCADAFLISEYGAVDLLSQKIPVIPVDARRRKE